MIVYKEHTVEGTREWEGPGARGRMEQCSLKSVKSVAKPCEVRQRKFGCCKRFRTVTQVKVILKTLRGALKK